MLNWPMEISTNQKAALPPVPYCHPPDWFIPAAGQVIATGGKGQGSVISLHLLVELPHQPQVIHFVYKDTRAQSLLSNGNKPAPRVDYDSLDTIGGAQDKSLLPRPRVNYGHSGSTYIDSFMWANKLDREPRPSKSDFCLERHCDRVYRICHALELHQSALGKDTTSLCVGSNPRVEISSGISCRQASVTPSSS